MPGLFVQRHALSVKPFVDVHTLFVKSFQEQSKTEWMHIAEPIEETHIYFKRQKNVILYFFQFVIYHFKGFKYIKKKNWKPDLIHVNVLTREGLIALFFKWIWGIPYVVTEHWTRYEDPNSYKGTIRKIATNLVVKNASKIMPVTADLMRKMQKAGLPLDRNSVQVVPNVVDTTRFFPNLNRTPNTKFRFIHISCFEENHKNVKGLLNAIHQLANSHQNFELRLIGTGPDWEEVVQYSEDLNFPEDMVTFLGLKENEELVEEIQKSDVHLLFSNYENLPVVNLECFACGVPVISTDVGGIREFFNDDLGRLIAPKDEHALVKVLQDFMDGKIHFDSQVIREYAIQHFSSEHIGEQLFHIYQQSLVGRK